MKKLIAVLLVVLMLPLNALACETAKTCETESGIMLPYEEECSSLVFAGCSSWAIDEDTRELLGISAPDEDVPIRPVNMSTKYIRGIVDNGAIRVKGAAKLIGMNGIYYGLQTLDNVSFEIFPEYIGLVAEIVDRRVGTEPTCAAAIAAAMKWKVGDRVSEIFFKKDAAKIAVGLVFFNGGADVTILWAGLFDADDKPELGLVHGDAPKPVKTPEPEPEATPEPEPEVTPAPTPVPQKEPTATPKPQTKCEPKCEKEQTKTCFSFGIDLSVWFKGCITTIKSCLKK